jgi:CubicO group peptidase (beta-lactamase class C family)
MNVKRFIRVFGIQPAMLRGRYMLRGKQRGALRSGLGLLLMFVALFTVSACASQPEPGVERTEHTTQAEIGEPLDTAPAAWSWWFGKSASEVTALAGSNNRLVSIQVSSASPLRFTVAMVQNTGSYAKNWWWFPDLTPENLQLYSIVLNARAVSMDAYLVNGSVHFAVVMLNNTSTDAKAWWFYDGTSLADLTSMLQQKGARLIDLRQYANGSRYVALLVSNTGPDATPWWWYTHQTISQINSLLTQNSAFLVSAQPADASASTFNVIMNQNPDPGIAWWTYYSYDESHINGFLSQNHARPVDVKSYVVNGQTLFTMTMVSNSWTSAQQAEATCDANVLANWTSQPQATGLGSPSTVAAYDAVFAPFLQSTGTTGGAVAVTKNGRLVLARGYGFADSGRLQLVQPDSRFRLASLSKQITSAAILLLIQKQIINPQTGVPLTLNDTPFTILGLQPNPMPSGGIQHPTLNSITIAQLLQHTGGFSREGCTTGCLTTGDPVGSQDNFIVEAAQSLTTGTCTPQGGPLNPVACGLPPNCTQDIQWILSQPDSSTIKWTPGTVMDYSNFGYCVLGAMLQRVTGTDFATWVQNNVLGPAGVTDLVPGYETSVLDREVSYYDSGIVKSVWDPLGVAPTVPAPYGDYYLEGSPASGGYVGSPVDLLRYQVSIDGRNGQPALLTPTSISELTANPAVQGYTIDATGTIVATPTDPNAWYGFGWSVNNVGNWWHTGLLAGTLTEQIHANNGFGFAAFYNSSSNALSAGMDGKFWEAFNGAGAENGDWLSVDLFDQYRSYTPWMNWSDYQSYYDSHAPLGLYPSVVEGRSQTGTPMYRAVYAPFKGSAYETHHNMDCLTFQQRTSALASQGFQTASLQSFVANDGLRRYQATWVKWSSCAPSCGNNGSCSSNGDCASNLCQNGKCQPPACAPSCGVGVGCGSNADCSSGVCSSGKCAAPSCSPKCSDGAPCNNNGDCSSFVCTSGTCRPPSCASAPSKCNQGAPCGANADCGSKVCANGQCQAPSCSPACSYGASCNNNGDCSSFVCGSNYTCQSPWCATTPSKCARGAPCGAPSDCGSGVCTSGLCQPPACAPSCGNGSACNDNSDCGSTVCTNATCRAPSCSPNCGSGTRCGSNSDCRSRVCRSNATCL